MAIFNSYVKLPEGSRSVSLQILEVTSQPQLLIYSRHICEQGIAEWQALGMLHTFRLTLHTPRFYTLYTSHTPQSTVGYPGDNFQDAKESLRSCETQLPSGNLT